MYDEYEVEFEELVCLACAERWEEVHGRYRRVAKLEPPGDTEVNSDKE